MYVWGVACSLYGGSPQESREQSPSGGLGRKVVAAGTSWESWDSIEGLIFSPAHNYNLCVRGLHHWNYTIMTERSIVIQNIFIKVLGELWPGVFRGCLYQNSCTIHKSRNVCHDSAVHCSQAFPCSYFQYHYDINKIK